MPQTITKSLGDIIRERTAGLPPEQQDDVFRRTVIEVLWTRRAVTLDGITQLYLALELEKAWLPKKELRQIERQRLLKSIERSIEGFRSAGLKRSRREQPEPTAIEVARELILRDGRDLASEFPTVAALEQFLKRARAERRRLAKQKPQR
jgi:hypothetical protein